ncbi:MAG: hypothetical protein RR891_03945 [Clostridium sp.]|uniref:hypothetical protein n=1 Tax=Clostridium sp. TaxID=1506 RepID=UPI003052F171
MADNNKSRLKDHERSQTELRKMYPKDGADVGIINGVKIGSYANSKDHSEKDEITY